MASDTQIKVLSLNCWGLLYVAKNRAERIRGIADELSNSSFDIIALQEIWIYADFELVRNKLIKLLPFSKFFHTGALGSGLAILSRYPILETTTQAYPLNGLPINVIGGDWIVGKGVGSVVISHPILDEVEIFNTHMFAKGGEDGPEVKRAHRLVGAWQLAKRVRASAALGRYVITTGDYNSIPSSLTMAIVREHGGLTDAWSASHDVGFLPPADSVHSAHHAIRDFGVTADSPLNTYTAAKPLDSTAKRWQGKRLDYVLYRNPEPPKHRRTNVPSTNNNGHIPLDVASSTTTTNVDPSLPTLRCIESNVVMTGKVPGHDFSFADHFGIEAILQINLPRKDGTDDGNGNGGAAETVTWATENVPYSPLSPTPYTDSVSDDDHSDANGRNINLASARLSDAHIATFLQALSQCYRIALARNRQHLVIFGVGVLALIALTLGSAWQPLPAANPVIGVVTIAVTWLSTTMLYSGFVGGRWEIGALTTVIEELELLQMWRVEDVGQHRRARQARLSGSS